MLSDLSLRRARLIRCGLIKPWLESRKPTASIASTGPAFTVDARFAEHRIPENDVVRGHRATELPKFCKSPLYNIRRFTDSDDAPIQVAAHFADGSCQEDWLYRILENIFLVLLRLEPAIAK